MIIRAGKAYFTNIDTEVKHEPGSMKIKVVSTNNGTELPITGKQISNSSRTNGTLWYLTRGGKAMGQNRRVIFKLEGEIR